MRPSNMPTYDQLGSVPIAALSTVLPAHTDGNAHMNVRHIYAHGVDGADALSERAGIDDDYRSIRSMGTFAAEHHITYFAEIHEGASIASRGVWIDRSARAAHLLVFITNETARELSAVLELIIINMDLSTRRALPFPPQVTHEMDRGIVSTCALDITMPLCGAMGVRRT